MGCLASRRLDLYKQSLKVTKEISNRDARQHQTQLPLNSQQMVIYACGYNFSLQQSKANGISKQNSSQIKAQNHGEGKSSLLSQFEELKTLCRCSKIQQCHQKMQSIKKVYHRQIENAQKLRDGPQRQQMKAFLELIGQDYEYFKENQALLRQEWTDISTQGNILYKYLSNKEQRFMLVEGQIQYDATLVLINLASFQKMKGYMHFVQESKELKKLTAFAKIGQVTFDFPFESKKQCPYFERVYDNINNSNSIFISLQSLFKNDKLSHKLDYYPKADNSKKTDLKKIICKIQPLESNLTKIRLLFNFNIQLDFLSEQAKFQMIKNFGRRTISRMMGLGRHLSEDRTANEQVNNGQTSVELNDIDQDLYNYFTNRVKQDRLSKVKCQQE